MICDVQNVSCGVEGLSFAVLEGVKLILAVGYIQGVQNRLTVILCSSVFLPLKSIRLVLAVGCMQRCLGELAEWVWDPEPVGVGVVCSSVHQ